MNRFVALLGRIASWIGSFIITLGLAVVAWLFWVGYGEARLQRRFETEGHAFEITVTDANRESRSWRDAFGGVAYVSFSHRANSYTTRFVSDTMWVGAGDRVRLLYHPGLDAFRQPVVERKSGVRTSRLVKWSVADGFSTENKILVGFMLMATVVFFMSVGLLVSLTGWTFLGGLARVVLLVVLGGAAVFFSYDSLGYYRYYQHLRSQGQPVEVVVLEKDKTAHGRRSVAYYTYGATVRLNDQPRVIPIEEAEYETLRPGDRLRVLYDREQED
ncbi:MAG: hypothetical protein H7Y12_11410, partial [Sphingobacteriaceae bacterium]|nr:hypothetical protein [Cytophagaceae bacterium]